MYPAITVATMFKDVKIIKVKRDLCEMSSILNLSEKQFMQ